VLVAGLVGAIGHHNQVRGQGSQARGGELLIPLQPGLHLQAADPHRIDQDAAAVPLQRHAKQAHFAVTGWPQLQAVGAIGHFDAGVLHVSFRSAGLDAVRRGAVDLRDQAAAARLGEREHVKRGHLASVFVLPRRLDPAEVPGVRTAHAHAAGAEPTVLVAVALPHPVREPAIGAAQVDVGAPVSLVEGRRQDESVAEVPPAVLEDPTDPAGPEVGAGVGGAEEAQTNALAGPAGAEHVADAPQHGAVAFEGL